MRKPSRNLATALSGAMGEGATRRLVVIGQGMVGHRLVEALLERDAGAQWSIIALAEESRLAYDRVALSSLFAGTRADDLALRPFADPRVKVRLGDPAAHIDIAARHVVTASGRIERFDELVLATMGEACFHFSCTVRRSLAVMQVSMPSLMARSRRYTHLAKIRLKMPRRQ